VPYTERYHPKNIPVILKNLATIYTKIGFDDKAFASIRKAYEGYKMYNDTLGLISCLVNESNVYDLDDENFNKEILKLKEAEILAQKAEFKLIYLC
jgi:hypothetical protein